MVLFAIADVLFMVKAISSGRNVIEMTNEVGNTDFLYINGIMLVNIWISFWDDIRAKSMQAALGMGMKRYQIVLAKWLNITLIAALDMTVLTVLQFIPLIAAGKLAGSFVIGQVILGQISGVLLVAIEMPLVMIVLFQTQQAVLGVIAYVYLTMGVTSGILSMAIANKLVQKFQLWNIGVADQINIFLAKLFIGQFDIRNFLMVLFYFALGFGVTIYLFNKKELDF